MPPLTWLEEQAVKATELECFPINLLEVRNKIKMLLSQVQRFGFFNEYTAHDFEHVNSMLKMAEWIIPNETKSTLTLADCLFITLSIYFHDLGLLIGTEEYEKRNDNPDYKRFLTEQDTNSSYYVDYINNLNALGAERKDKVQYEEYVRRSHGIRVKTWIEGIQIDNNNADIQVRKEIHDLIGKLGSVIRQGLAIVCESHTIDDIADITKYKVSMPYGDSEQETVNLQYVAIILRVVDLFQITKKRAPSILYRVINPKDPISQLEWQKQNAVRNIRAAKGRDKDGNISDAVQPDTIEVFATFNNSDGFFGLTSYLTYARKQLELCQDALKASERHHANPPLFPWKKIDDSGVEAVGFLTRSFGFELDQDKILDLLTGHTLYNDSNVVIRELTQNSLDAVRLQNHLSHKNEYEGKISITWNTKQKILEVIDNGTGMSQNIIESHLLKVGSSRYQDEKFREKHPEFTSISRFGIGVLSAFMVADSVEITTCSPEDDAARQISLRSVHGKYLIKLLDKVALRDEIGVFPHGTRIKLKLRSSAEIDDVLETAKMWLMFPQCKVTVKIDDNDQISIGYASPKEAIEDYLSRNKYLSFTARNSVEVREFSEGEVTLAFAVINDSLFKDWSFLQCPEHTSYYDEDIFPAVGLCIEGVGVDFNTPGFKKRSILAIANSKGKGAPKTNVARSAIEDTMEYKTTLATIYRLYSKHILMEIERFKEEYGYSISRAVEQVPFIIEPLFGSNSVPIKPTLLDEELSNLPTIITEENGIRESLSFNELKSKDSFWTLSSPLISSVESFVREAPSNISAKSIINHIRDNNKDFLLPEGIVLCNFDKNYRVNQLITSHFEPISFEANEKSRRLTLKWGKIGNRPRWISSSQLIGETLSSHRNLRLVIHDLLASNRGMPNENVFFSISDDVKSINLDEYGSFHAHRIIYLNPNDPLALFLRGKWNSSESNKYEVICAYISLFLLLSNYNYERGNVDFNFIEKIASNNGFDTIPDLLDIKLFTDILTRRAHLVFNAFAWNRRDEN